MLFDLDFRQLIITLPAVILALSFHEYAHARMAYALGDPTAKIIGRLTVNPLKHLDLIGTLMLLFFHFGWAKPVPFNPDNLRTDNKYFGSLWVALAGPLMNLLLTAIGSVFIVLAYYLLANVEMSEFAVRFIISAIDFFEIFAVLNLVLAVFNMLPIPPLDGSKVLAGLLPARWAEKIYLYEQYGFILMIIILMTGLLGKVIDPVMSGYYGLMNILINKVIY